MLVVGSVNSGVFSTGTPPGSVTLGNTINHEFTHLQNGADGSTQGAVVMNK